MWAGRPSRASLEVERLTLRAWNALAEYGRRQTPGVEVTVLGMVEDAAHCDAALLGELAHVACLPLDAECSHPEFGIMTVDCILRAAWAQGQKGENEDEAAAPDVYILANGDVVFRPTLLDAVGFAYRTFVNREPEPTPPPPPQPQDGSDEKGKEKGGAAAAKPVFIPPGTRGFALVGRRLDLNVTLPSSPDDPPLTEASLLAPGVAVRVHQASGIDYFAFTPNAFPHAFPPFLIGRWRWDNALLLHFLVAPGVATVDGSEVVHALHLGMAESSGSEQHRARMGGRYNDELATGATGRAHTLGRIDATEYVLKAAAAGRNGTTEAEEGGEQEAKARRPGLVLEERGHTTSAAQLAALQLAGGCGAGLANEGVTVVPVPYGQVAAALEWACWARAQAGVGKYVLLAADREEAKALAVAVGGNDGGAVVHLHPNSVSLKGGAGGNVQYYRGKKMGRASPAALALGTAQVVQRLLRLNLTVTVADIALKWNRDPSPLLRAPEGPDESCDLAMLDLHDHRSNSSSSRSTPLYLIRPSRQTEWQWRRVLACIEDTIRHPKGYGPGFSCLRARLMDGVIELEKSAEDEKGRGGKDGDGYEEAEEPKPWRVCRVDGRAPRSWFPTQAALCRQAFAGMPEPWGIFDEKEEGEEGAAAVGGGRLWDAAAGKCTGALDGWLLAAIQPLQGREGT